MYLCTMCTKKICSNCKIEKNLEDFHKNKRMKHGRNSWCKACAYLSAKKSMQKNKHIHNATRRARLITDPEYREKRRLGKIESYWKHREQTMFVAAKRRSKEKGFDFSITQEDIMIPDNCPILNVPLDRGRYAPSLDRIDNSKGYISGNVWVISRIANIMKNSGSTEEIYKFCENLPKLLKSMI